MRPPGRGVEEAPIGDRKGPWVRLKGEWVEHVFGREYASAFNTIPAAMGAAFAITVQMRIVVNGGLYMILPFVAVTSDNNNGRIESKVTVSQAPSTVVFETLLVSTTFGTATDVDPLSGHVPVPMPYIGAGEYIIALSGRQPISPGTTTVLQSGINFFRVA